MSSFPEVKKVPIKDEHDFIVVACDGIWDCFTNEQIIKLIRSKREKGPKNGIINSPTKLGKKMKELDLNKSSKGSSSPSKISKSKSETTSSKKLKVKGETSFIIEELMN